MWRLCSRRSEPDRSADVLTFVAAESQGVSLKMNGKHCIFVPALDLVLNAPLNGAMNLSLSNLAEQMMPGIAELSI